MNALQELFRHNTMMNGRLLDACRELPPEQLEATVEGTYGTIAATLVHIANGQEGYAARFEGVERPERLEEAPFPGFDVLRERLARSNAQLEKAAAESGVDGYVEVSGDDPVGTWRMHRDLLLVQAVNHGTEHRSQVATILTQLGIEPPNMDGWTFFFAGGHMEDV